MEHLQRQMQLLTASIQRTVDQGNDLVHVRVRHHQNTMHLTRLS